MHYEVGAEESSELTACEPGAVESEAGRAAVVAPRGCRDRLAMPLEQRLRWARITPVGRQMKPLEPGQRNDARICNPEV